MVSSVRNIIDIVVVGLRLIMFAKQQSYSILRQGCGASLLCPFTYIGKASKVFLVDGGKDRVDWGQNRHLGSKLFIKIG